MNEENKANYYAIIPANIRYSKDLKANEKLLYGEITALSNRNGYCYAQNRYFAKLYDVSIETISRWISHLQKLGFVEIEIIKNEKKEIISRNIYIIDTPYCQKNQYPYCLKDQEGIDENVKENNIKYNKEDLFILLINKSSEISNEFYEIIEKLELNYTNKILENMQQDKIEMLKDILYVLYDLYNGNFRNIILKIKRNTLINLYSISKEHNPDDFLKYYKRTIINKYTNNSS